ncbi:hypothetical protein CC80DRAFT_266608 [Byssothecium circinans]|uniref:Uncharacterized protein n=1 Tax=Byssothecium circinans TaxID=147558 RepID=A0A6A5U986_9PLEO|nr:hypothetical protein CC80DRAFT_266608 [Byssothecium circinans]
MGAVVVIPYPLFQKYYHDTRVMLSLVYLALFSAPSLAFSPQSRSNGTTNSKTADSQFVGWKGTPQVRGTFDLLLSCLTTLSLCAWTAYHPNVFTTQNEWRRLGKRVVWMSIAVLIPEVVLWCAWEQWWASKKLRDAVQALGEKAFNGTGGKIDDLIDRDDGEDCRGCREAERQGRYSRDYGLDILFAQGDAASDTESGHTEQVESSSPSKSNSFRIFKPSTWRKSGTNDVEKLTLPTPTWTHEQAFFATSGGFAVDTSSFYPLPTLTLTPSALQFLASHGLLPTTTPATVSDKSKADYVAKVLVCVQAGWFLV